MRPPARPLFLARRSYRYRRLVDSLRLLPVLGALLFIVPVLGGPGRGLSTVGVAGYLFAAWAVLIVLTAVLTRRVRRAGAGGPGDEPGDEPGAGSGAGAGPGRG